MIAAQTVLLEADLGMLTPCPPCNLEVVEIVDAVKRVIRVALLACHAQLDKV
jgi:hypothetical protein